MGRMWFLKRVAINLLYFATAMVILFLPTLIVIVLYWNRFTSDVISVDIIVQFMWLLLLATLMSRKVC